jgi:hypothetical protein
MAINRNRRKIPSLHMEERAIIRTWDHRGEEAMASKFYATAMDFTQQGLQIYARSPLPIGEVLDIAISLQGQTRSYSLKGVARSISPSDDGKGYVIEVTLVEDKHAGHWRRQFH